VVYVLCKLQGTGKPGDSYRADFPTYRIVAVDPAGKQILVDVRDDDVPAACKKFTVVAAWIPGGKADCVKLQAGDADGWQKTIRERYVEGYSKWKADDAVEPKAVADVKAGA
jgi:hypothetical protein